MKILPLVFLLLFGCATNLTEQEQYEKADKEARDRSNWAMCEKIYNATSGVYTVHKHGSRIKHKQKPIHEVREDLIINRCRAVVPREAWEH